MPPRLPLGYSDFRQLRRQGLHFVDKSLFVADVVRSSDAVILLPRPRRFGKTLNLSMLAAYLGRDADDPTDIFSDLAVWQAGADVRAHFRRHPVIALTFKDVKNRTWADCRARIVSVIASCAGTYAAVVAEHLTKVNERAAWQRIVHAEPTDDDLGNALLLMTTGLHQATGERCVVLIDEYDTPLHAAWLNGYWGDAIELFRNMLSGGLKDNPHIFKGVVTGILRISKESLFSGLNNLGVYSLLRPELAQHFGFTADEVADLAQQCGAGDAMPAIEQWYNGYRFGGQVIYNPWSVLNYLASQDRVCRPYWVNTASNELLIKLLVDRSTLQQQDLELILAGGSTEQAIDENTVFTNLDHNATALWSFLLFCGYLRADELVGRDTAHRPVWRLTVPNREVRFDFASVFGGVLERALGSDSQVQMLCQALLAGDAKTFGRSLSAVLQSLSHHDLGGRQPERVYQAFVLGLLIRLAATHEVTSNRESGYGRCDVLVCPRQAGQPGVVVELKVRDAEENETVDKALQAALGQIRDRDYAATLRERGANPIREMAAVFDGKRVWVQVAG